MQKKTKKGILWYRYLNRAIPPVTVLGAFVFFFGGGVQFRKEKKNC